MPESPLLSEPEVTKFDSARCLTVQQRVVQLEIPAAPRSSFRCRRWPRGHAAAGALLGVEGHSSPLVIGLAPHHYELLIPIVEQAHLAVVAAGSASNQDGHFIIKTAFADVAGRAPMVLPYVLELSDVEDTSAGPQTGASVRLSTKAAVCLHFKSAAADSGRAIGQPAGRYIGHGELRTIIGHPLVATPTL